MQVIGSRGLLGPYGVLQSQSLLSPSSLCHRPVSWHYSSMQQDLSLVRGIDPGYKGAYPGNFKSGIHLTLSITCFSRLLLCSEEGWWSASQHWLRGPQQCQWQVSLSTPTGVCSHWTAPRFILLSQARLRLLQRTTGSTGPKCETWPILDFSRPSSIWRNNSPAPHWSPCLPGDGVWLHWKSQLPSPLLEAEPSGPFKVLRRVNMVTYKGTLNSNLPALKTPHPISHQHYSLNFTCPSL